MAPLVLHNVPEEELYVGKDGVRRPFAVVGASDERRSARLRRQAQTNQGSFGRARSRTRAGSVGPRKQQTKAVASSTTAAADLVFSSWKQSEEAVARKQKHHPHLHAHPSGRLVGAEMDDSEDSETDKGGEDDSEQDEDDEMDDSDDSDDRNDLEVVPVLRAATRLKAKPKAPAAPKEQKNEPTEVILCGYRSADFQYAAIHRYEQLAGRICEDYPRHPPATSTSGNFGKSRSSRFASGGGTVIGVSGGLREAAARAAATVASNGVAALTPAERQAVMQRVAGGEHWVKVTFESAAAAEAAYYASPQNVLGYLVYAEPYRGVPLRASEDVAQPDPATASRQRDRDRDPDNDNSSSHTLDSGTVTNDAASAPAFAWAHSPSSPSAAGSGFGFGAQGSRRRRGAGPSVDQATGSQQSLVNDFPGDWHNVESTSRHGGTTHDVPMQDVSQGASASSAPSASTAPAAPASAFCRRIPTARRATVKAPEQALLPRDSAMRSLFKQIPLLHRLAGTIIGDQVPRREDGIFDWDKASLYWRIMWFLDYMFTLFGGEILDANKDD